LRAEVHRFVRPARNTSSAIGNPAASLRHVLRFAEHVAVW
jgi:hypothetical protein